MNEIEKLQGEVAMLSRRLRRLEILFEQPAAQSGDEKEAGRVAAALGFDVEIMRLPSRGAQRLQLARELRKKEWSYERIARALNCSERTIRNWLSGKPDGSVSRNPPRRD